MRKFEHDRTHSFHFDIGAMFSSIFHGQYHEKFLPDFV